MTCRALFIAVSLAAIAGAATAEPPPPPQPTEDAPPLPMEDAFEGPPELIFISPAGEPFRGPPEAPYPVAAWFARADTDKDGVLSSAEFTADALGFFDRLDVDKDGRVDGFENADYERDVAPEITGVMRRPPVRPPSAGGTWRPVTRGDMMWGRMPMLTPKPGRPQPGLRRQGAAQYGLLNEPHPVRGADADLDGKITRAEALAAARRRFGLLDLDGDGRLTHDDLPETPAQILFETIAPPDRRKP